MDWRKYREAEGKPFIGDRGMNWYAVKPPILKRNPAENKIARKGDSYANDVRARSRRAGFVHSARNRTGLASFFLYELYNIPSFVAGHIAITIEHRAQLHGQ